jgi:hypothetical protein
VPPLKFDDTLTFTDHMIDARGPLSLDAGETVLAICVKIYQGEELLAECDPGRHPFVAGASTWKMDAEFVDARTPQEGPAVAAAVAVTGGPEGAMNSYQWVQPHVTLRRG